ncbi:MAG: L-serine ammonia-lyase [Bacilli bacterium]|nr:L-serine ammonia-lyase [Bacilli bacterium]
MESIRELYKIGRGPSSSHTMGPEKACDYVIQKYHGDSYIVKLYGSLSLTGKGHLTDQVILEKLPNCQVIFSSDDQIEHPNTMDIIVYKNNEHLGNERIYSVGGGKIIVKGEEPLEKSNIYPHKFFFEIKQYCEENNLTLYEYVYRFEDDKIKEYLFLIWKTMKNSIKNGLKAEGFLPGDLKVERNAKSLFDQWSDTETEPDQELKEICSYAYAVSEENANGGVVVTAPTCGASGVVPGVLFYLIKKYKYTDEQIVDALATAGIIGNLVKHNASISGAEAGCQAEVGTACSMAAACSSQLLGHKINKIEYAAEIALEHHLGLTCDPILGFVQIPCIERNAVAALRALNASKLSNFLVGSRKISFDMVVETMYQTGKDLSVNYKETSLGGLAVLYNKKH